MNKGDLLFVYGTLRKGGSADLSRNPNASFIDSDRINAKLYSIGWFPGILAGDTTEKFDETQPYVVGDVFLLNDATIKDQLDAYEGYPSLYDRRQVITENGHTVWVYTYNGSVSEDSRIKDGDWLGCLQKVQLVA